MWTFVLLSKSRQCKCYNSCIILSYDSKYLGEKEVTVAITPNGYADGITLNEEDGKEYFVMPEEATMRMNDFLHSLDDAK